MSHGNYFGAYGSTASDVLRVLEPVLDDALESHRDGDYAAFVRLITTEFQTEVSEAGFEKAHRELAPTLGPILSKRFLGSLNRGGNPVLLFAARYTETSDDVLIQVGFRNGLDHPKIDWIQIG